MGQWSVSHRGKGAGSLGGSTAPTGRQSTVGQLVCCGRTLSQPRLSAVIPARPHPQPLDRSTEGDVVPTSISFPSDARHFCRPRVCTQAGGGRGAPSLRSDAKGRAATCAHTPSREVMACAGLALPISPASCEVWAARRRHGWWYCSLWRFLWMSWVWNRHRLCARRKPS